MTHSDDVPRVAKKPREKKPEDVAAGRRVKQRREELGLTQAQLSREVGLESGIAKHEQGVYGFAGKTLAAVAKALGVSERWILYGDEESPEEPTVEEAWTDTAAWLELEANGRVDFYRSQGVSNEQLEHIRRTVFRGPPDAGDYELMLQGALRNAMRHEHPSAQDARERREREGGPNLSDMLDRKNRSR